MRPASRLVTPALALAAALAWSRVAAGGSADLSVTQTASSDLVHPGDSLTFTITIANQGPDDAPHASLFDQLPAGVLFERLEVPAEAVGFDCTTPAVGTNGKILCTQKDFPLRSSATFTLDTQIAVCAGSILLENTVQAGSDNADSDPYDNTAIAYSTVIDPGTCDDGNVCTVDDACIPTFVLDENFDSTPVRNLPDGWSTWVLVGPLGTGWTTTATVADTPPLSAFVRDAPEVRDVTLNSPPIAIETPSAQLFFMNRYDLEFQADGGVLEIQIPGRDFMDILDAGGQFETGGYVDRIRTDQLSPIGGRLAWTGFTNGFEPTIVDLPASAVGKLVVLRWRLATDQSLGRVGQWIDSITVSGAKVCGSLTPNPCDDADACTVDACDPVAGCTHVPRVCDDGNPCTDDACDASSGCFALPNVAPCNDGNLCTQTDVCAGGQCRGSNPLICTDSDPCTANACIPSLGCVAVTSNFDTSDFSANRVDGRDLEIFAGSWSSCPGDPRYDPAVDIDKSDPCIDADDFHRFMLAFGKTCGT